MTGLPPHTPLRQPPHPLRLPSPVWWLATTVPTTTAPAVEAVGAGAALESLKSGLEADREIGAGAGLPRRPAAATGSRRRGGGRGTGSGRPQALTAPTGTAGNAGGRGRLENTRRKGDEMIQHYCLFFIRLWGQRDKTMVTMTKTSNSPFRQHFIHYHSCLCYLVLYHCIIICFSMFLLQK